MKLTDCRIVRRIAVFALATACSAKTAPVSAAPVTHFPTNTGLVKYHMTMNGSGSSSMKMSNDINMTWISGGMRFRQDSMMHMNTAGRSINMNTWTIYDGKSLYVAMPNGMPGQAPARKVAMRMTMPADFLKSMATGRMPGIESVGAGRVVGHASILGKPCVVRVMPIRFPQMKGQIKMWMWQTLPLRTETTMNMKMQGKSQTMEMIMAATQLKTNVSPSPSLFRLPAGYKVQEMGDLQKQMRAGMQQGNRRR